EWATLIEREAKSTATAAEAEYWLTRPWERAAPLPLDFASGAGTEGEADSVLAGLDAQATRGLLDVAGTDGAKVKDALLSALAITIAEWTGGRAVLFDLERH